MKEQGLMAPVDNDRAKPIWLPLVYENGWRPVSMVPVTNMEAALHLMRHYPDTLFSHSMVVSIGYPAPPKDKT